MRRPDTRIAQLGSVAPEIAFRDVNNQNLKLSGLRGSFVLVYFTPDPLSLDSSDSLKTASTPETGVPPAFTNNASADAKLAQLNQLSDALNAKRVMVLEGELSPSTEPMKLLGVSVNAAAASVGDDSSRYSRLLLDADGEIARNYRVDAIAAQPTLFVIDGSGVIRYRGSFEQASAENLMRKLAPVGSAKQFSSAPTHSGWMPLASLNHF